MLFPLFSHRTGKKMCRRELLQFFSEFLQHVERGYQAVPTCCIFYVKFCKIKVKVGKKCLILQENVDIMITIAHFLTFYVGRMLINAGKLQEILYGEEGGRFSGSRQGDRNVK